MSRISINEAANTLGLPAQSLRCWISLGTCPFGEVVQEAKSKHGHKTYFVCKERLEAYLSNEMPRSGCSRTEA